MHKKLKKNFLFYKEIFRALLRRKKHSNGRILIIKLASLGDSALVLPYVLSLIESGLHVTIICRTELEEFWRYFAKNADIIPVPLSKGISKDMISYFDAYRKLEFEAIFSVSPLTIGSFICSFFDSACKYAIVEGKRYYKGSCILFKKIYKAGANEHVSSRYQALFRLHIPGFEIHDGKTSAKLAKYSEPYILIHPAAKWKPRRWAQENFRALAIKLAEENNNVRIIFGIGDEELFDYFLNSGLPVRIKLVKAVSITELIEEIIGTILFIGNDSGPAHIANLLNKPTIVLWGPGNLDRIRPLGENVHIIAKEIECRPCRQYRNKENCIRGENICLKRISVDEVFDVLKGLSFEGSHTTQ